MQERSLLLVGNNFPDWLCRFFLRLTNKSRLSEKGKREWMVEQMAPQESLTCFLRSYSKETEVLSALSPVDFVAELHRRWMQGNGGEGGRATGPEATPDPRGAFFFVSYSRIGDLPKAQVLVGKLRALAAVEWEIWFDRQSIEPGQDFRNRILDGIQGCRYFLPLRSQDANNREEGFVLTEWRDSNKRLAGMNRSFVVPVVVDSVFEPLLYTADPVREWRRTDFGFAPQGVPDDRLTERLHALLREARRLAANRA